jgi:uncharacterized protein (DUF433 family)
MISFTPQRSTKSTKSMVSGHKEMLAESLESNRVCFSGISRKSICLFYNCAPEGLKEMSLVIEDTELASLPITVDPNILGGTPVFRGTRVPVDALLSNLEAGVSIDEFLENFPTVSREQALEVIEFSRATLHRLTNLK